MKHTKWYRVGKTVCQ